MGPFSANHMRRGYVLGNFTPETPIKYSDKARFFPLSYVFPLPWAPFSSAPPEIKLDFGADGTHIE